MLTFYVIYFHTSNKNISYTRNDVKYSFPLLSIRRMLLYVFFKVYMLTFKVKRLFPYSIFYLVLSYSKITIFKVFMIEQGVCIFKINSI